MSQDNAPTFNERIRDHILATHAAEHAERRRIEDLILGGDRRGAIRRDRVGEMVRVGGDWLVEVIRPSGDTTWTCVVGGETTHFHWRTQDKALLHLIAGRHGDRHGRAVPYAARVLGIPADEP